ncbi:penicillin-binding protein 1A [Bauldia litoralis]|uniref:penicillin-binding protein 1A n=1 Tax=Bauldia litoralis TaxID=665467 RepID=UPI000B8544FD|nr:penicillin-binding protein 1A [Bauldia litoralis]
MLRIFGYLFGIGVALVLLVSIAVAWYISGLVDDLPDYDVLADYEPPVTTRIHASDGTLIAEFARERRLYVPIQAVPNLLKAAYISAEDKNFYTHGGIDYVGILRAIVQNVRAYGSGQRMVGASTITQQIAKNFLLTNERSLDRKIKEAILAVRIEGTYSKNKILELYLNDIFLGLGSYGVAAAALTYFDKSLDQLTLSESAYLAALPKAPNNYHPFRYTQRALERRNWVIDRMVENGYATEAEGEAAKAEDLGVVVRSRQDRVLAADYYAEDVRRQLIAMFGEDALYEGGLSVRTSLDLEVQAMARKAMIDGLLAFDTEQGWRGPITEIDVSYDWGAGLAELSPLSDVPEWRLAVVLSVSDTEAEIGLRTGLVPGTTRVGPKRDTGVIPFSEMEWAKWAVGDRKGKAIKTPADVLSVGDVVYAQVAEGSPGQYRLRQIPEVGGGLVVMDPHTGRVLAMVGGFSFAESQFNRATQAMRQPGSSFKPFVYASALDSGYTPASVILDAPIAIDPGFGQPLWRPQNYSKEFYGPSTLRTGIEKSRNVMTVRLAQDLGMPIVAEYARRFGVYDELGPYLPLSLGSGETTVMRMVAGYSVFANGGRAVRPTLIDRIQNRFGETVFRHDTRGCEGCEAAEWTGQDEPVIIDDREQVLDPMTAYQITSMLEGVVQRGTATAVYQALERPVAGKTGTTNDYRDAWFVGFSPDLAVGVYVGYDQPRSLGRTATGGRLAAPIFTEFMQMALVDAAPVPFRIPDGMTLIPINRRTGKVAPEGSPDTILEAFKPGTGPLQTTTVIGTADTIRDSSDRRLFNRQSDRPRRNGLFNRLFGR